MIDIWVSSSQPQACNEAALPLYLLSFVIAKRSSLIHIAVYHIDLAQILRCNLWDGMIAEERTNCGTLPTLSFTFIECAHIPRWLNPPASSRTTDGLRTVHSFSDLPNNTASPTYSTLIPRSQCRKAGKTVGKARNRYKQGVPALVRSVYEPAPLFPRPCSPIHRVCPVSVKHHHPAVTSVSFVLLLPLKDRFTTARGSGNRLFTPAFMIAFKVICGDTYSNKYWALSSGCSLSSQAVEHFARDRASYPNNSLGFASNAAAHATASIALVLFPDLFVSVTAIPNFGQHHLRTPSAFRLKPTPTRPRHSSSTSSNANTRLPCHFVPYVPRIDRVIFPSIKTCWPTLSRPAADPTTRCRAPSTSQYSPLFISSIETVSPSTIQ
ncbi:hypothetical protein NMY22_g10041 [Coprinellus aureogranulatus]|nr:hypothetical protein NMY22_g10041 [Coprinellus aureogranulatus]